jgi:hypothetical protein
MVPNSVHALAQVRHDFLVVNLTNSSRRTKEIVDKRFKLTVVFRHRFLCKCRQKGRGLRALDDTRLF